MVFPFCFPATFDSAIAGLEEAKSLAGEKSSDGFRSFLQILRKIQATCQSDSPQARITDSSSTNAVSFSPTRTTTRFPPPRCASAMKIVRPLESLDRGLILRHRRRINLQLPAFLPGVAQMLARRNESYCPHCSRLTEYTNNDNE